MSKKQWVIGTAVLLVFTSVVTGILFAAKKNQRSAGSLTTPLTELPSPAPDSGGQTGATSRYADPAGFSFQYPKTLAIADETPPDDAYYSRLTLKSTGESMKMTLLVKDTPYKTTEEWLRKDPEAPKNATVLGSVSIGGAGGTQYGENGKLLTVAIDQGVIYRIESIKDDGFWERAHRQIVSTFVLSDPNAQAKNAQGSSSSAPSGNNTVYETEEVVQ